MKNVVILSGARCGSSLLRRVLESATGYKIHRECFFSNRYHRKNEKVSWAINDYSSCKKAFNEIFSNNLGVKIITGNLPVSIIEQIFNDSSLNCLFLYRKDDLRRELSIQIARRFKLWHDDYAFEKEITDFTIDENEVIEKICTYKKNLKMFIEQANYSRSHVLSYEDTFGVDLSFQEKFGALEPMFNYIGINFSKIDLPELKKTLLTGVENVVTEKALKRLKNLPEIEASYQKYLRNDTLCK